jgi:hypothetical protein
MYTFNFFFKSVESGAGLKFYDYNTKLRSLRQIKELIVVVVIVIAIVNTKEKDKKKPSKQDRTYHSQTTQKTFRRCGKEYIIRKEKKQPFFVDYFHFKKKN